MPPERFSGVLCPVVTPFDAQLNPDAGRLLERCRWLLSQQVGLAVFGTTSEANSLSVEEKIQLLDSLLESGVEADRLMPGTGCSALTDTIRLTQHAVSSGCGGVLMLPPFYYKAVGDDGLYAYFAEVIERVASDALQIYLYHIPPVANVGISADLIERLIKDYPDTIAGIKDSSGDWSNTAALLARQWDDFRVFAGSETFLLQTLRAGGAGCISATANINAKAISDLCSHWQSSEADQSQRALDEIRDAVTRYPVIPALKAVIAHQLGDSAWRAVRPPLMPLDDKESGLLVDELYAAGLFEDQHDAWDGTPALL